MNRSLIDQTKSYLQSTRGQWKQIASEVDGVSYWWIYKFMGKGIASPGYKRLEAIINHANRNGWTDKHRGDNSEHNPRP